MGTLFRRTPDALRKIMQSSSSSSLFFAGSNAGAHARGVGTLAVEENGSVKVDPEAAAPILEVPPASQSNLRTILLNRPRQLNALTYSMLARLHSRHAIHESDDSVHCILLAAYNSAGRAFSAGGDIRYLHDHGQRRDFEGLGTFFHKEYSLNHALAVASTPQISLWDGLVMGGGVGVSVHGRFRVATENALFSMPECSIGLHPDVGASYFLPRMQGGLGMYLGLTGARLKGQDVRMSGLATHFIESHFLEDLVRRLEGVPLTTHAAIDRALKEYESVTEFDELEGKEVIDTCFVKGSVEEILLALQETEAAGGEDGEFAKKAREAIERGSPSSLKVTFESLRRGKNSSLAECLDMEYRITMKCLQEKDLYSGIKAKIIEKTGNPQWNPPTLQDVSKEYVESYFAPLNPELGIGELNLAKSLEPEEEDSAKTLIDNVVVETSSGQNLQSRL